MAGLPAVVVESISGSQTAKVGFFRGRNGESRGKEPVVCSSQKSGITGLCGLCAAAGLAF